MVPLFIADLVSVVIKCQVVERSVLAKAVRLHLEHRVMVFGGRTCVFDRGPGRQRVLDLPAVSVGVPEELGSGCRDRRSVSGGGRAGVPRA